MNRKYQTTITINLTEEERKAFAIVNEILQNFQTHNRQRDNNVKCMESMLTGECVETQELARVRGVLGFFEQENQTYKEIYN